MAFLHRHIFVLISFCCMIGLKAQTAVDSTATDTIALATANTDTINITGFQVKSDKLAKRQWEKTKKQNFTPNPQRALWLAAICPGLGQIYNRKYWKLPIFYGGFLGCTYALMWNNQMYKDYSQAYLDIMDDDPNTKSYMEMLPPNYDISGKEERFKQIFKNRKDRYRRWRDMSAFAFIGVYALSIIDAYVDAQLSVFDISPDLSLHLQPSVIKQNTYGFSQASYGMGCCLSF